jgi:hypothetical protein
VQSLSALLVENRLCLESDEATALIDAALTNPSADGQIRGMLYALAMDHAAAKMHDTPRALAYALAAVASDAGSVALRVNLIHMYIHSNEVESARREYEVLKTWKVPARNQTSVNELKSLFDTLEKNANQPKPIG